MKKPSDLRQLDLNLLKTFAVLMEEQNVSRAAERLAVTQPAVSGMLTRLRDSFNDPLFVRAQHGVIPTKRAEELAQPIKHILRELEQLIQPPEFDPATSALTITLAGTDYSLSTIIVPLLARLQHRAPYIRIATHFIQDDKIPQQMEQGSIDIAFMTPETAPADLRGKTLFEETYVCALSKNHPLAQQSAITLEQFCHAEHAIVSYLGGAFSGVTDTVLAQLGKQRRVTTSVPSFLILLDILRSSELLAVVPSRLVADAHGLTTLALPFSVPGFSKYMVWHERTHTHPAYQWLREQIQACVFAET